MTHSFRLSIYLDFTDSIDFCSSQNENWFHAISEFVDSGVAIESRRIKQIIITFLIKSLKKSYLLFICLFIYLFIYLFNLFHHDYNAKKD